MKKVIVIILSMCILITGCIEKKQSFNQNMINKEYITYAVTELPKNLTMSANYDENSVEMLSSIFQGLVKKDDEGNIVPALAERWEISKDKTIYRFYIRNDAYWSNGEPITSENFKKFFSIILSKDIDNPVYHELSYILGADDYRRGKVSFESVGITTLEDNVLQIKLNNPCSFLLEILTNPLYGLRELDNSIDNWNISYSSIKYSGQYVIQDVINDQVTLVPNERYLGDIPENKIKIIKVQNDEEALANLQLGKIDVFKSEHLNNIDNVLEEPLKGEEYKYKYLVFNLKNNKVPYKVRNNIEKILDKEKIYNEVIKEESTPIKNFMNLEQIGIKNNTKEIKDNSELQLRANLKLVFKGSIEDAKVAKYLKSNIEKNSNISIELKECGEDEFKRYIEDGEYDITLVNYYKDYNNPMNILEKFTYGNPFNYSQYNNSLYNGYVNLLKTNRDGKKEKEIQNKCFQLLQEDIPVIPLYASNVFVYKNKYIDGLKINYKGYILFKELLINKNII